jgi:GntR family transcriptional regulator/MocR family aminotransferase
MRLSGEGGPADLHVSLDGRRDLTQQIYRQVREAIMAGRLRRGEPLPPTRELARRLAVSRNTVTAAYDRLSAEGMISGRAGDGTYVSGPPDPGQTPGTAGPGELRPRELWDAIADPPRIATGFRYDLRTGMPDTRMFPYQRWRALVARELSASGVGAGAYADPAGHAGLRAEIARHVGLVRGVQASADDVLVTNGMQQAMFLLARVLLEPGSTVAVEDPGYPPPHDVLRSLEARLAPVPVDDQGLVVDAIPASARMVYVTPSHQYPLGVAMSPARRMALLEWAGRHGGVIIEDDYDSEFRFGDRPLDAIKSLDRAGRVCYVGSFSKVMLPTLRLGFVIAPPSLRGALRKAKYVTDWHTELPVQAALARFISSGGFSAHVRRMRRAYAERRDLVLTALAGELSPWLTPVRSAAGLHVSALSTSLSAAELFQAALRLFYDGLAINPLSLYAVAERQEAGLVIGYGMVSAAELGPALAMLRDALRGT